MTQGRVAKALDDALGALEVARASLIALETEWRNAQGRLESARSERLVNERVVTSLGLTPGPAYYEQQAERLARESKAAALESDARLAVEGAQSRLTDAQQAVVNAKTAPKRAIAQVWQQVWRRCMSAREIAAAEAAQRQEVTGENDRSERSRQRKATAAKVPTERRQRRKARREKAKAERERVLQATSENAMAERQRRQQRPGGAASVPPSSYGHGSSWPHYSEREKLERIEQYGRWLP